MTAAELDAPVPSRPRRLRIALACPGIGLVQRGFERFFSELFEVVQHDFDVTLFKGAGARSANEKVLPFINRNGRLVKIFPVHKFFGRTPYHSECLTLAMAMLPHLRNGSFDIVHTVDPPLTRLLYRMRAWFNLRFKLLFTECTAMWPGDYPPADHTQHVSPVNIDAAIAFGHAPETSTLLPMGLHTERFAAPRDRSALRRARGIDDDAFVVLSVAAINRDHKRTDYLIDEIAGLGGRSRLLLAGSLDHGDPDLIDYARKRLGENCTITQVPFDQVVALYHLADVMVHAATYEGFGLAIVEGAASGIPLITHDAAHFRWLIPNPHCWIDMREPGTLAARLRELMQDPARGEAMRCDATSLERFSWDRLRPEYAALYRRVAELAPRRVSEADCRKAI